VKDDIGDLNADSHNTLNRRKDYIEIHTTEPLVPDHIPSEIEIIISNVNKCKSPGSDQLN
jgi:hypothetical protein